jgi:hypothetical protein
MLKTAFLLFAAAAGLVLSVELAFAGSATWLLTPSSGDWNAPSNWTPGGPPDGPTDTATFRFSMVSDVSISVNTQVSRIVFSPGASAYTVSSNPGLMLSIGGTGITNDSGFTQNFVTTVDNNANIGVIEFTNSATAGFQASFTNNGSAVDGTSGSVTQFRNNSTAGHGTFTNEGGLSPLAGGGLTLYFDRSTSE